jgi:hypothetical protein
MMTEISFKKIQKAVLRVQKFASKLSNQVFRRSGQFADFPQKIKD